MFFEKSKKKIRAASNAVICGPGADFAASDCQTALDPPLIAGIADDPLFHLLNEGMTVWLQHLRGAGPPAHVLFGAEDEPVQQILRRLAVAGVEEVRIAMCDEPLHVYNTSWNCARRTNSSSPFPLARTALPV